MSSLERAPRYGMQMGIRYRAAGQSQWRDAKTENISRSGVLFRVAEALKVSDLIEMRFMFPPGMAGKSGTEVLCQGWVVRSSPPVAGETLHLLAAKILDYRFVRDLEAREVCDAVRER
ncbi:MAG: PilZ domain-containing protein [Terriglobia bacterium]